MFGLFGKSAPVVTITPQEAHERLMAGAMLVDVREGHEWLQGRIPGAIHAPLSSFAEHAKKLPHDKDVIFYCLAGGRSQKAVEMCAKLGINHKTHMGGGISAWRVHRLPVE